MSFVTNKDACSITRAQTCLHSPWQAVMQSHCSNYGDLDGSSETAKMFFFAFKKVIMRRQNKLKLILLFFPSSVNFSSDWFTRFSLLLPAWYWLPWVSPYDALAFKSVVISVSKKTERWWALLLEEIKIPFRISSACASKLWRVLLRKHTGETPFAGHLPSTS